MYLTVTRPDPESFQLLIQEHDGVANIDDMHRVCRGHVDRAVIWKYENQRGIDAWVNDTGLIDGTPVTCAILHFTHVLARRPDPLILAGPILIAGFNAPETISLNRIERSFFTTDPNDRYHVRGNPYVHDQVVPVLRFKLAEDRLPAGSRRVQ